ncbi:MAG TPA: hypothetical protein VKO18_16955 [Terriglobia bacterium]|nr:hypothetical protein [Terriglobia bacterium]
MKTPRFYHTRASTIASDVARLACGGAGILPHAFRAGAGRSGHRGRDARATRFSRQSPGKPEVFHFYVGYTRQVSTSPRPGVNLWSQH